MAYETLLMIQGPRGQTFRGITTQYYDFTEESFASVMSLIDVVVDANVYYKSRLITQRESFQIREILKQVAGEHFLEAAAIVEDPSSPRFELQPAYSTIKKTPFTINTSSGPFQVLIQTYKV